MQNKYVHREEWEEKFKQFHDKNEIKNIETIS